MCRGVVYVSTTVPPPRPLTIFTMQGRCGPVAIVWDFREKTLHTRGLQEEDYRKVAGEGLERSLLTDDNGASAEAESNGEGNNYSLTVHHVSLLERCCAVLLPNTCPITETRILRMATKYRQLLI
jgi:hypothetical protein